METQNKPLEIEKEFKSITRKEALRYFLRIQSVLQKRELQLSDAQIEVLVIILTLPEKFKYNLLGPKTRKVIMEEYSKQSTKPLTYGNLQRLIGVLRDKGVITRDEYGEYELHSKFTSLIKNLKSNLLLHIKFNINDN